MTTANEAGRSMVIAGLGQWESETGYVIGVSGVSKVTNAPIMIVILGMKMIVFFGWYIHDLRRAIAGKHHLSYCIIDEI